MFMIDFEFKQKFDTSDEEEREDEGAAFKKKLCSKVLFFPSNLQAKTAAEYLLQIKISIKHLEGASSVGFS